MADTKKEKLLDILENLQKEGDISESMAVSRDGLPIVSNTEKTDVETFAAMAAAMQGAAETAVAELKQGEVEQIIIESNKGKIISIGAGAKAILITRASKTANLGLAMIEMKKAAKKIEDVLK